MAAPLIGVACLKVFFSFQLLLEKTSKGTSTACHVGEGWACAHMKQNQCLQTDNLDQTQQNDDGAASQHHA